MTSPVVSVFLGQSKVYQEQFVAVSTNPHQKVVWLDVAVDEVLVVDVLDSPDHLISQHEHSLHGEPPGAEVEEVLEAGSEKVHDQDIVVPLRPIPPNVGNAYPTLEDLVKLRVVEKLQK